VSAAGPVCPASLTGAAVGRGRIGGDLVCVIALRQTGVNTCQKQPEMAL